MQTKDASENPDTERTIENPDMQRSSIGHRASLDSHAG
jgi:hypothetical protein